MSQKDYFVEIYNLLSKASDELSTFEFRKLLREIKKAID